MKRDLSTKSTLTTGQVSAITQVAVRTVAMWIDQGLLKGYRCPGSPFRRVVRTELVAFLERNDMPTIEQFLGVYGNDAKCASCEEGGMFGGVVSRRPYCKNCIEQAEKAHANRKAMGGVK